MPIIPADRQIVIDTEYLKLKRPDFVRACRRDLDDMIKLYAEARDADAPVYAREYPSPERIAEDIEEGLLWFAREDGEIVGACALTAEPVFRRSWTLFGRYETFNRFPGENWFRPGERYMSVLRHAVRLSQRRRGLTGELTALAVELAYSCGIYEIRTRLPCDRINTGKVLARLGFKIVGGCYTEDGRAYFGYFHRKGPAWVFPPEQRSYRPLEEEYDGDAYQEYDYGADYEDLMRRLDEHRAEKEKSREELMEEI